MRRLVIRLSLPIRILGLRTVAVSAAMVSADQRTRAVDVVRTAFLGLIVTPLTLPRCGGRLVYLTRREILRIPGVLLLLAWREIFRLARIVLLLARCITACSWSI